MPCVDFVLAVTTFSGFYVISLLLPDSGSANLAAEWFKNLGFVMPYGVNMADFILDVASGAVVSPKLDPEQSQAHLIECSERCDFVQVCRAGLKVSWTLRSMPSWQEAGFICASYSPERSATQVYLAAHASWSTGLLRQLEGL